MQIEKVCNTIRDVKRTLEALQVLLQERQIITTLNRSQGALGGYTLKINHINYIELTRTTVQVCQCIRLGSYGTFRPRHGPHGSYINRTDLLLADPDLIDEIVRILSDPDAGCHR